MDSSPKEDVITVAIGSSIPDGLWQTAVLIRSFEERLLQLFSEGKVFGTVHTCIGQEFSGIAIAQALRPGDLVYSNHRCHGHYIARTGDVDGLMAEIMGRESGVCGGRGGSQHICSGGVFSNGVQGGIVPVSAGLAFAQKLRDTGNIVVVFIGDGTLGEGVVYESLNVAAKWELPLLVVLENNLYAQSTHQKFTIAGEILKRPEAFGIRTAEANTWELTDLIQHASDAVVYVRSRSLPLFFKIDSYRLMAHSKGDDDRDTAEVQRYWAIDPIARLRKDDPPRFGMLQAQAEATVTSAVRKAEAVPFTKSGRPERRELNETAVWSSTVFPARPGDRVVSRIYQALRKSMEQNGRVVCLGEDIEGPYGGAFKVTKDLSLLFPGRVRNTPISEAAIVGISNGLAMGGLLPVCEIMFGDFLTLAMDQIINHAAKFRYMYNGQVSMPVVVRTPMGGKRGYGATHSQSLEKHFLGIPDTTVLAIHHRFDPSEVYERLLRTVEGPVLVIENKLLYGQYFSDWAPEGFSWEHTGELFPTSRLSCGQRPDLTIFCYGGMLLEVERVVDCLVDEHEIIPEIICPISLYPLNLGPILESVVRSGHLLTVEEGQGFCALGAEVLARIQEHCPEVIVRSRRLSAYPSAIPSCKPAEDVMLPGVEMIRKAVLQLVQHG